MASELRVPLYEVERDSAPTVVAVTGVTGARDRGSLGGCINTCHQLVILQDPDHELDMI